MKKTKHLEKKYYYILFVTLFFLFLLLAYDVLHNGTSFLDVILYHFAQLYYYPIFTSVFKIITNFTGFLAIIFICFLSFVLCKKKNYSFWMAINVLNTAFLNVILKLIIARPRPSDIMLIIEDGYSFPSGHSMMSFAFYGFIIYLLCRSEQPKKNKIIGSCGLMLLILLIGLSRIYLGVHYGSDVLAGFLVSAIYLCLFIPFVDKQLNKVKSKEVKPLTKSFEYAFEGIKKSIKNEQNMKIHFATMALVIVLGFYFHISYGEWLICLLLFGLIIGLELVNTAIEATIDLCCPSVHPQAKLAKDAAAGAVLVMAIISAVIGFLIFAPKIVTFVGSWI